MAIWSKKANGAIKPCRFVKQDAAGDHLVLQAGAGDKVYGISQAGTRRPPYSTLDDGNAAVAGEDLEVFGPHEDCLLEISASVTPGTRLKSDANGMGTPVTANNDEYGAIALVAGASGDFCRVESVPNMQYGV